MATTVNIPFLTGGVFQDSSQLKRFLDTTRRNFIAYAVAQNLPKISPMVRLILERADQRPFQAAFIVQPVYPDLSSPSPQYLDTSGNFTINDFNAATINAIFEPAVMGNTIRLNEFEIAQADSPNKVVNELAIKVSDIGLQTFAKLTNDLIRSRTSDKEFYGILDVIGISGVFGELDRTTYTWWVGTQYSYATDLGNASNIYQGIERGVNKYMKNIGSVFGLPSCGFTDYATFQRIIESFTPIERYNVGHVADITEVREHTVKGVIVGGVPVFPDPYLSPYDAGGGDYVGDIIYLNLNNIHFSFASPFSFYTTEWQPEYINAKLSWLSVFLIGGQLWSERPKAHLVIKGVPSMNL